MDDADPERLLMACVSALLPAGESLLLAVSGGSDSMALLAAAAHWDSSRLAVAHVHHGLRSSAYDDAQLVREQCERMGLPCEVVHAPPDESAATGGAGRTETAARARRLDALVAVARRRGCSWVAAAHHRDDAHETMLLHLLRGHRGDRALSSIPTVRRLGRGVRLLHPFLYGAPGHGPTVGRRGLAAYRERRGIPHREDPTNQDTGIPRNAIRALLRSTSAPLDPVTLERARRAAMGRLERRIAALVACLQADWRAEGSGCIVRRQAWLPPEGDTAEAWVPELLRLLGAGLARPRVVAPRASVVGEIERMLARGSGALSVPASPAPLQLKVTRLGVHLPAEALPAGSRLAGLLTALARTSLYV